jgi:hypothetical protein
VILFACGVRRGDDLPDRLFLILGVQPHLQKYISSDSSQIKSITAPSRPTEGRLAIVTNAGRDAVDADVLRTNSA